jgi:hypothetical protein
MIDCTGVNARRNVSVVLFVTMVASLIMISKSVIMTPRYADGLSTFLQDIPGATQMVAVVDGAMHSRKNISETEHDLQVHSLERGVQKLQPEIEQPRIRNNPSSEYMLFSNDTDSPKNSYANGSIGSSKTAPVHSKLFRPTWNGATTTWNLPTTRFTHHITTMIVDEWDMDFCQNQSQIWNWSHIKIHSENPSNNVESSKNLISSSSQWANSALATALKNGIFNRQPLTYFLPNGTMQIQSDGSDYSGLNGGQGKPCHFGNSAPDGYFCAFNIEDIKRWVANESFPPPLPWNERQSIPVWRGKAWLGKGTMPRLRKLEHTVLLPNIQQNLSRAQDIFLDKVVHTHAYHKRLFLVHYSFLHPHLVDAKLSQAGELGKLLRNTTINGMDRYLPFDPIPSDKYYTQYQVQIVMGGIGAAFRTARVMGQGITVILQDFPHQEWYYRYMTPFVHYIPLDRGLQNLTATLEWSRNHPDDVYQIAQNGKAFFEEYLSFDAMKEFYYELLFRMMLKSNNSEMKST